MSFDTDMVALLPNLKAFAVSLCGDVVRADDLVSETCVKALDHRTSFQEGTNLRAWLFTILRNTYFSEMRNRRRESEYDDSAAKKLVAGDNPEWHMHMSDFADAFGSLPVDQRDALMLVGVQGIDYADAARMLGVAVGTLKSRLHRARAALSDILDVEFSAQSVTEMDIAWDRVQKTIREFDDTDMPHMLTGFDE